MDNKKSLKVAKYNCELCGYITNNITDYNKHLSTAKHARITMDNKKSHICFCGKPYLYASGLSKHKNICFTYQKHKYNTQNEPENVFIQFDSEQQTYPINNIVDYSNEASWSIDPSSNEIQLNQNMMYKLFKELMESNNESNKEFKQIILEQQTKILELASKPTVNNTQINKTNNNITVNMFLTDYCKNAMTLKSFIKSINPSTDQIMYMTNKGNREGLIQIMKHSLCSMKITERPIHFTDIKRNTNWVKNDDGWIKEPEQDSMMRLCKNINRSCSKKILEIIDEDKEFLVHRSEKHELFLKMVMEANGGAKSQEDVNATFAINTIKDCLYLGKDEIQNAIV